MSRTFQGRAVLPGRVEGEALVTRTGVNMLASFMRCLVLRSKKAVCSDQDNSELHGKVLTGRILCLPQTVGSTVGGLALETAVCRGVAPEALLFSEHIDTLAASGVVLAEVWFGKRIVTVDRLGEEFLEYVEDGQKIEVREDGTVVVG
ncbi:MAG: aconitase X swivel domain-containing protein [Planctomycetota bacterium]|jgi:predicted aconitase with swiveling domain